MQAAMMRDLSTCTSITPSSLSKWIKWIMYFLVEHRHLANEEFKMTKCLWCTCVPIQHYHVHLLYIQLKTCQKKNWFHLPTAILINNENSAGGNILVSELEANITNYIITPLHAHFDWFLFKFNVGYGRQMHWWCHNEQSSMSFFTS